MPGKDELEKKTEQEGVKSTADIPEKTPQKKDYLEIPLPQMPRFSKSSANPLTVLLVILLMGLSFALGSLYTRLQYFEQGGTMLGAQNAKQPTTVQEAFQQYAKQLSMDTNKFQACMSSGKYNSQINADIAEGDQLGVHSTPNFFVNGIFLGGAFPYSAFKEVIDKELAGTNTVNYKDYSDILQQAHDDSRGAGFDPVRKNVPLGDAPIRGDENAKITLVEYSDFQCPFCEQAFPTVKQIMQDYKGKVRLVYKQYPITSLHPNAMIAAEASECAKEQGKFWEYHDLLFTNQQSWASLPQTQPTGAI